MMTAEERKTFLKRMGYNPRMLDPEPHIVKRKEAKLGEWRPENDDDAKLLLRLNNSFKKKEKTRGDES